MSVFRKIDDNDTSFGFSDDLLKELLRGINGETGETDKIDGEEEEEEE